MASHGTVVAGEYVNWSVSMNSKGELVLQSGFKKQKINSAIVSEWDVVAAEGTLRAGVANSARFVGNVAETALGSVLSGNFFPSYGGRKGRYTTVRIDWTDGKQSLIKMPKELFAHFELTLNGRRAAPPPPPPEAPAELPPDALGFDTPPPVAAPASVEPDVLEQIGKLAVLRDQGILSEDEFAAKKVELLARL